MNTPKNFALQLGALITLYASIASFTALLFGVITILFPDAAENYYAASSASSTIRFSIATLLVVYPVYLLLTRTVNQIRRKEDEQYLTLTKWLIYLSLVVGGAILAGDLVAVINGYLNGELTTRFALKALVLAVVILAAFYYYLKDAQGYWQKHEKESIWFGIGTMVVVVAALVLGFMNSETPKEVREARIDDNQITDLQDMQWRIEDYYRVHSTLPETVGDVYDSLPVPLAPENRAAYEYKPTSTTTYELCATFAQDSNQNDYRYAAPISEKNYTWTHSAGKWCFERTIETKNRILID